MMLVISRKRGEVVWIGDIAVRIQEAKNGKASIAIDAPDDVRILRHEVRERIKAEEKEIACRSDND